MTSDDDAKKPRKKTDAELRRIQMLYMHADQTKSGFAEELPSTVQPLHPNRRPNTTRDSPSGKKSDVAQVRPSNAWVLSALEDLANFAEFQRHAELEACLREAHYKAAAILAKTENV